MVDAELRQQRYDPLSSSAQGPLSGQTHSSQEDEEEGGHNSRSPYRQAPAQGGIPPQYGGTEQPEGAFTAGPFGWGSIVLGGQLQDNEFEQRLAVGAAIGCRLRGVVREQLGLRSITCAEGTGQGMRGWGQGLPTHSHISAQWVRSI